MPINISDSGPMKSEIAKIVQPSQLNDTNLKASPTLKQVVHQMPYGPDGMLLTPKDNYNALSTILPNAKAEKSRQQLKKESKKKKEDKEQKKKQSFWQWLFSK